MTANPTKRGVDVFLDALEQYGVTRVFGNPGTTELPIVQGLADREMSYVLGAHEDIAVGMAAGYAIRRRYHSHHDQQAFPLGVANLHLAPGLAHGLGNLDGARWSGAPILLTTGQHSTQFQHEEPLLHGDLAEMAAPFTKWSAEVTDVDAIPSMVRRAVKVALTPPTGPVFLDFPLDVQLATTDIVPERLGDIPQLGRGRAEKVERATEALANASSVVIITGDQLARTGREAVKTMVSLAEETGAAVYGEVLMGEVNFPTDHPQWVSMMSVNESTYARAHDADVVVFAGVTSHTTVVAHDEPLLSPETTTIYLGNDSWELGKNQPADVAVYGDMELILSDIKAAISDRISNEERDSRLNRVQEAKAAWPSSEADHPEGDGMSKNTLVRVMEETVPEAAIVSEAVTSNRALYSEFTFAPEQHIANRSGGLGYGLPAAVGAAIAEDESGGRSVIGFLGDGSYLYYPQSLYTAVREDVDLTVVVSNNRNYRILKDNTAKLLGGTTEDYEFVGMDFEPPVDLEMSAGAYGADGETVADATEAEKALDHGVNTDGPYVINALVHD